MRPAGIVYDTRDPKPSEISDAPGAISYVVHESRPTSYPRLPKQQRSASASQTIKSKLAQPDPKKRKSLPLPMPRRPKKERFSCDLTGDDDGKPVFKSINKDESDALQGLPPKKKSHVDLTGGSSQKPPTAAAPRGAGLTSASRLSEKEVRDSTRALTD